MIHLSSTDQTKAKIMALRLITANANRIVTDRSETLKDKEDAVLALMSIEWAPSIAQAIGSRDLNRLLHYIRQDVLPADEYRIFADMIAHATDETRTFEHAQWALWRGAIIRYYLFEISPLRGWISLVARLDSRGIRTPTDLARCEFSDLEATDWQLPHPDMLIWLWQGARQGNTTRPPATSHRPLSSAADLQSLILSLRTDDIRLTGGVRDYEALKRELGLPRDFEALSQAAKCDALRSFV